MHHMRAGWPVTRWPCMWYTRQIPKFSVGATPGTSFKVGGVPQILSAACNCGSAVFQAIQWRCWAWPQLQTPLCWRSWVMVCHQPSHLTRLGSAFSWWQHVDGLNVYASVPSFLLTTTQFPTVGHLSCPPVVSRSPFGPPCQLSCVSRRSVILFLGSPQLQHTHCLVSLHLVGNDWLSQMSWHSFLWAWLLGLQPAARGPAESLVHRFLSSQQQLDFYGRAKWLSAYDGFYLVEFAVISPSNLLR
jgi:hypothetical protein